MKRPALEPGPWVWRQAAGSLMLTTAHSGARVVLAASYSPRIGIAGIVTRQADGTLRKLTEAHPVALALAAVPELLKALERMAGSGRLSCAERRRLARGALIEAGYSEFDETPPQKMGGRARAAKLPPERRSEIAREGAKARWGR